MGSRSRLRDIINSSQPYVLGSPLDYIYVIPNGRLYRGFWGENGYNSITVIGWHDGTFYNVTGNSEVDVIWNSEGGMSIDVPGDLNCIRIHYSKTFCFTNVCSSLIVDIDI